MLQVKQQHPSLIMVDYTLPDVIHEMAELYIKHRTPFVMGVRVVTAPAAAAAAVVMAANV